MSRPSNHFANNERNNILWYYHITIIILFSLIESGIGSNLKTRLSSDLQVNIESHEQEMIERMTALLPAERQQFSRNILPRRESFEV